MHQRIAIQSCLEQSAVKHKSQPAEDSLIGIQRCRRNSDPEHWQQFRNQQYNKFLTSGNMNENLEGDFSESGRLQNNPGNDEADYVGTQISRPVTKETGALESECKFHATDLSVGKSPDSFVDWNNIGYGCMLPNNAVFGHSVTGKTAPTSFPDCNVSNSVFTTLANQNYSFCQAKFSQSIDTLSQSENIVVSNDSITQQQQQRVCFRPSLLSSSEHAAPIMYTSDTCFSLHYNQPSVLNSSDMSTCNPPETAHNDQTALAYEPLVWSNDDASLMGPPDSKGKIHCIQSVNEADYLANTDLTCHVGNSKPQLVSDVSVNELASYMEHMVHIPGRMSEMAQRMYL
ncbi:unnamed protein product [Heterobilharzia americana]|nr:unnamed protein product [Heterobilharzia americana]